MSTKPPRTSRLARGAIAGIAAARAGVAHIGHKAQNLTLSEDEAAPARERHEAELGRILFSALNQLKGTALKASQLLSMELGFLPEPMRRELAKAHYQVTPLNRALVIKLLRHEFRQGPDELFQHFEPQAFAAASLGQVHAATLHDGQAVAVKLQYPGMAASIHSDMRLLRGLLQAFGTGAQPRAEVVAQVMADIEAKLAEELDYQREAEQLRWFGEHLSLPGLVVPQPIAALSSRRVLTMQRLSGQHLNEWLATQPPQAERDRYGQLLFDAFMHSLFALHRLQADPHPGNFVFMPDGRLGLLDFGCTQAMSPAFCTHLAAAWSAWLREPSDELALQQAYQQLGLISPDLSPQAFRTDLMPVLAGLQHWQGLPFKTPVYDFGQHPAMPHMNPRQHRRATAYLQALPPELPYFDRAYLGLLQLLRSLGARVRTANPWIH